MTRRTLAKRIGGLALADVSALAFASSFSGAASASSTVSSTAAAGHFPLGLVVGGDTVATSAPVAVIVTLATTGGPDPMVPGALALLLLAARGIVLVAPHRAATR